MFRQQAIAKTAQSLRSPAVRAAFQKRFASTAESTLKGAEDNAFNRQRKAVKDHAAATSGMYFSVELDVFHPAPLFPGWFMVTDVRLADLWRKLSL